MTWLIPSLAAASMASTVLLLLDVLRSAARRYRASIAAAADEGFADLFVFVDPRRLLLASVSLLIALPVLALAAGGGAAMAVAAAALGVVGPRALRAWLRRRRERQLLDQLPDALAALAGALRAGLSLTQALGTLAERQPAPTRHEYALVLRKQRLGMPLDQAIEELALRTPRPEFRLFATAVRVARELGGNLAETLERLADTVRRKRAMEDRIDALTSQGRMQGWVVGLLPLLLLWVLQWLEPDAMRALYTTTAGWAVLVVLAVLLSCGALLIRRIVRIDV